MEGKVVFIVEDHSSQRLSLHESLVERGFEVESAGNVRDARTLVRKLDGRIGVAVLDMRLEDKTAPQITGANIGLEIIESRPDWPPEFLIHSAYAQVDYYKLAQRLGAADYLSKDEVRQEDVIRHVRALSLKHALSVERPDAVDQIMQIVETSRDRNEAVAKFCRKVLVPKFEKFLGAPFVLLFTEREQTHNFSDGEGVPTDHPAYHVIQALAHCNTNRSDPFLLDTSLLRKSDDARETKDLYEKLHGGAFLPLTSSRGPRLSLGIMHVESENEPLAENACELARVLSQHLRPAILDYMLNITSFWAERHARRKTIISATSHLCLYIGQEQLTAISDGVTDGEVAPESGAHRKLQLLAEDLIETGEFLRPLGSSADTRPVISPDAAAEPVRMNELIRAAWDELSDQMPPADIDFDVEGDCGVDASPEDLSIAVTRLLQWLAQRRVEAAGGRRHYIRVRCAETAEGASISFEDRSNRLTTALRQRLFSPFTSAVRAPAGVKLRGPGLRLPLYLAKVLVEEKHSGTLDDHSEEIEGNIGHRFVMQFPPPEPERPKAAAAAHVY